MSRKEKREGFRKRFTRWYIKQGFVFYVDLISGFPVYVCPWYVKPWLFLFSPSSYYEMAIGEVIYDGFKNGLESMERKEDKKQ